MEHNQNDFSPEPVPGNALPRSADDPGPSPPSFLPVPVRSRHDGWTPARQLAFIEHLADTLSPEAAAARVEMSVQSANRLRRRADAAGFSAAWDAALRRGLREQGRTRLVEAAINGRVVRRFYHGKLISEERVYSERFLLTLLEKAEKLFGGEGAAESAAIDADWQGAMNRLGNGALEGGYRVWKDRSGDWLTNFPPPPGFPHCTGEPGDPDFCRLLTQAEEEAWLAGKAAHLERGAAARDHFFGFSPRRRAIDRRAMRE